MNITLRLTFFKAVRVGKPLIPKLGYGVSQSVKTAAQPLIGHNLTKCFGHVSQWLGSDRT